MFGISKSLARLVAAAAALTSPVADAAVLDLVWVASTNPGAVPGGSAMRVEAGDVVTFDIFLRLSSVEEVQALSVSVEFDSEGEDTFDFVSALEYDLLILCIPWPTCFTGLNLENATPGVGVVHESGPGLPGAIEEFQMAGVGVGGPFALHVGTVELSVNQPPQTSLADAATPFLVPGVDHIVDSAGVPLSLEVHGLRVIGVPEPRGGTAFLGAAFLIAADRLRRLR